MESLFITSNSRVSKPNPFLKTPLGFAIPQWDGIWAINAIIYYGLS